jgi:chromosome segregation ATPase
VTIVQTPKPATARSNAPIASGPREGKVDPNAQRQRDSDARRLLEAELKREEARLTDLQKEFNNGEPERQGGERNYQRYADRVNELRSAIARKEEDIAAIKRELAKLQ